VVDIIARIVSETPVPLSGAAGNMRSD